MTSTVTTTTTDISLGKLIPCPANVRRTGAGVGIEALAASIQAHGLLQSLVVRPKLDGEGQASDRYEVVAGGRRLAALKLLAKQKRITKGTVIPCRVLDTDELDGSEASLAENVVRQDMHPAEWRSAVSGSRRTTGALCVGAMFQVGRRFGTGLVVRNSLRIAAAGRWLAYLPHIRLTVSPFVWPDQHHPPRAPNRHGGLGQPVRRCAPGRRRLGLAGIGGIAAEAEARSAWQAARPCRRNPADPPSPPPRRGGRIKSGPEPQEVFRSLRWS